MTDCTIKDPALFTVVVRSDMCNHSQNFIKCHHFSSKLYVAKLMSKTVKPKIACEAKWIYVCQQILPHMRRTWNHQSSWTPEDLKLGPTMGTTSHTSNAEF